MLNAARFCSITLLAYSTYLLSTSSIAPLGLQHKLAYSAHSCLLAY